MKCPCCEGEGGYTDVILDDGSGPYYPCEFCDDKGSVSIYKRIEWLWDCVILDYFRGIYYNLYFKYSKKWNKLK